MVGAFFDVDAVASGGAHDHVPSVGGGPPRPGSHLAALTPRGYRAPPLRRRSDEPGEALAGRCGQGCGATGGLVDVQGEEFLGGHRVAGGVPGEHLVEDAEFLAVHAQHSGTDGESAVAGDLVEIADMGLDRVEGAAGALAVGGVEAMVSIRASVAKPKIRT